MPDAHPPLPGDFVEPNLVDIEKAVDRFTFPISKRDMLDQIPDGETLLIDGRNFELGGIVSDLRDDFFQSEDEFREALRVEYADWWASGNRFKPVRERGA